MCERNPFMGSETESEIPKTQTQHRFKREEEEEEKNMSKSSFSCSYLLDWRLLLLSVPTLSLLIFLSLSSSSPSNPFFQSAFTHGGDEDLNASSAAAVNSTSAASELRRARVAVCLVGGARRFELTGPSIVQKILKTIPSSDLFLHSPLDDKSFKLSLLRTAPRIASVRIFEPQHINETESAIRVLTASNSPNGIQGLLQYFTLVEGCLTLIQNYQNTHNFTYDWIVRTRVDGYWRAPLDPANFVPGQYTVPLGSSYGGLNDRLGVGDLNTSTVALSRLSLIPALDAAGFRQLNSETAFRAQLNTHNVSFSARALPFCVVSDRRYAFPVGRVGVPVAAMSSRGALSGAKCRPCAAACKAQCAVTMAAGLQRGWSWIDSADGKLELCDAHAEWDSDWEELFDRSAGKKLAAQRKRVKGLSFDKCVSDFEEMKKRSTGTWQVPSPEKVCAIGLKKKKDE